MTGPSWSQTPLDEPVGVGGGLELVWAGPLDLGEGPAWEAGTRTLLFVDIPTGTVLRLDPGRLTLARLRLGDVVGAAIPRASGGIIAVTRDALVPLTDAGPGPPLCSFDHPGPAHRMNDAKCDPAGRLFAGSMRPGGEPTSALYRVGADLSVRRVLRGVGISNGMAWAGDGRTMYHADSAAGRVDRFEFDPGTGEMSGRVTFCEVAEPDGVPDGMCIDAEDHIWVALFGGGRVRRYSPAGEVVDEIVVPAPNVTSCGFGGDESTDLYITTAALGTDHRAFPHAGGLFRAAPGVPGTPLVPFAG